MIQLIIGEKGKGKTKILLDKANTAIKEANGNIVYLDKNSKHMYELNNRVRLIDVSLYPVKGYDQLEGFICGMISQDRDLEYVYLDSFLKIAAIPGRDVKDALDQICKISEKYNVNFVISVSITKEEVPENLADAVIN